MGELWVRGHVLGQWRALRGRPWEVGGWLLGYRDGDALVVTHATAPRSHGTPFGVTISGRGHRPAFDRLWDATGGRVTFLGDWHTHPGGPALPSDRDRDAAAQVAEDDDFKTPRPLVAIVATSRLPRKATNDVEIFERELGGELTRCTVSTFSELPPGTDGPEPWPAAGQSHSKVQA